VTRRSDPGEVAFVLHTHLPYLKNHGVWPVGEEWLFQAWAESWLPVTGVLLALAEDGHRDVLTLGVTPLVAHQVADPRLRRDLGTWLGIQTWRSEEQRWQAHMGPEVQALGPFYWLRYARLSRLHEQVEAAGGILAVWADLASRGVIELLGGPATHPYLPLQTDPDLIDAQLACGLDSHAAWAGQPATGLWSPECGYRPRGSVADATAEPLAVDRHGTPRLPRLERELPGLEEHYADHGITHVLVDAATVVRAAGGRDRDWTRRPAVPDPSAGDPYELVHDGVRIGASDVVAYARDLSVAYHVWSPTAGYPGNVWYRDYWAKGSFGAHPSWRVTDKELPPDAKAPYEPEAARAQVARDVDHLHGVLRSVLDPRPGQLTVAAYDTELFGHWWFEGPQWLDGLLRAIADDSRLRTTTLASRLERRAPQHRMDLPESSWGYAKGHASWVTGETRWMWASLRAAEQLAADVCADPTAPGPVREQVARELALLQCSDWPFMVTRGNSPDYAGTRFRGHLHQLETLAAERDAGVAASARTLDDAPADVSAFLARFEG